MALVFHILQTVMISIVKPSVLPSAEQRGEGCGGGPHLPEEEPH